MLTVFVMAAERWHPWQWFRMRRRKAGQRDADRVRSLMEIQQLHTRYRILRDEVVAITAGRKARR